MMMTDRLLARTSDPLTRRELLATAVDAAMARARIWRLDCVRVT